MTLILDGKAVRDNRIIALSEKVKSLMKSPILAIIQVGGRPDSTVYIQAKKTFAAKIGVNVSHIQLPETITQEELIEKIEECNEDTSIHGIIVQLPLPVSIDQDTIIETIDENKDCDGLTSFNVKRWMEGREDAIWPATTRGVKELLRFYKIDLFGKNVTVVGRSMLVGKPLAAFALEENATVTVCHSKTQDLISHTRNADVLIVAAGKVGLIRAEHVKQGAIVIDVGINTVVGEKLDEEVEGKKLVGDVDFDAVKDLAGAITPVPGGVGPMTVLGLFENLVDLCLVE